MATNEQEDNVEAIVQKYLDIYARVKDKVSHEHIEAVLAEIGKEIRMKEYKQDDVAEFDEPATKKQINFLKRHGVEIPAKLTKNAASEMIENIMRGLPGMQQKA